MPRTRPCNRPCTRLSAATNQRRRLRLYCGCGRCCQPAEQHERTAVVQSIFRTVCTQNTTCSSSCTARAIRAIELYGRVATARKLPDPRSRERKGCMQAFEACHARRRHHAFYIQAQNTQPGHSPTHTAGLCTTILRHGGSTSLPSSLIHGPRGAPARDARRSRGGRRGSLGRCLPAGPRRRAAVASPRARTQVHVHVCTPRGAWCTAATRA